MLPKSVPDHLIMDLQNYTTYVALTQHAMHKADLLMTFHPGSNRVNLAQKGNESDEERLGEKPQCNLCDYEARAVYSNFWPL